MATAEFAQVAKTKGRPKRSERDDVTVKIDRALVGKAKLIATDEGISVAELLSELLSGPVDKRYVQMIRRMEGREKE